MTRLSEERYHVALEVGTLFLLRYRSVNLVHTCWHVAENQVTSFLLQTLTNEEFALLDSQWFSRLKDGI